MPSPEQIAAITIDFAARLRRDGAGPAGIRAAILEAFPDLSTAGVDRIARDIGTIPPERVMRVARAMLPPAYATASPSALLRMREEQPGDGAAVAGAKPLPQRTAAALAREPAATVAWEVEPWVAAGSLTAITGRPKVGKTTFILDMIAAYLAGASFLAWPSRSSPVPVGPQARLGSEGGREDRSPLTLPATKSADTSCPPREPNAPIQTPGADAASPSNLAPLTSNLHRSVLYLTEQPPASFRASLERSGLLETDRLHIVFWHELMALPWAAVAAQAGEQCAALGARLLVVDTLSQWAGMSGDMENQAGDAFAALQPLQQIAASDVAIVFLQHERKAGGDTADAGRGSSAFAGAVDTLISFRWPPSHQAPQRAANVRLLTALSRFDAVLPELYIERRSGVYSVIGTSAAFARQKTAALLHDLLPLSPDTAMTVDDLARATGTPARTMAKSLSELLSDGLVSAIGSGRRGDPVRYWAGNID